MKKYWRLAKRQNVYDSLSEDKNSLAGWPISLTRGTADYTLTSNLDKHYEEGSLYIIKSIKYSPFSEYSWICGTSKLFFFFLIQLIAPYKHATDSLGEFFIESLTTENNSFPMEKSNSLPDVQAMHFCRKAKSQLLYFNLQCSDLLGWNWYKILKIHFYTILMVLEFLVFNLNYGNKSHDD